MHRSPFILRWVLFAGGLVIVVAGCDRFRTHDPQAAGNPRQGRQRAGSLPGHECCGLRRMPHDDAAAGGRTGGRAPFARAAPNLVQLAQRRSAAQMTALLETGQNTPGGMPIYHMSHEDAVAATAYMRSLGGAGPGNPSPAAAPNANRNREIDD